MSNNMSYEGIRLVFTIRDSEKGGNENGVGPDPIVSLMSKLVSIVRLLDFKRQL